MAAEQVRVLRVIARLNIGGPAIHASTLSTRLRPARFKTVTVHGSVDAGEASMADLLGDADQRRIPELGRSIRPWSDAVALWRLMRITREFQPHIVHTHTAKAGTLGRLAAAVYNATRRRTRARVVHTYHGHVFSGYFSPWRTNVFIGIERLLSRMTDRIIAISDTQADDLVERFGVVRREQVSVVPLGLDLGRFAPQGSAPQCRRDLGIGDGEIAVGIVGRLVPIKNHDLFLDAAAELVRRGGRRLKFVIVGGGELMPALTQRVADLGLDEHVTFTGWRRDLERIYPALDVVVLTSINEGTPVSLIEAMAAERAVVATAVGGVPDVVRNGTTGLLVDSGARDQLVDAIAGLCDDAGMRERLGAAAREEVVRRFSSERLLADIEGLYESLLPRERRADGLQ